MSRSARVWKTTSFFIFLGKKKRKLFFPTAKKVISVVHVLHFQYQPTFVLVQTTGTMSSTQSSPRNRLLKVSGLGHSITLEMEGTATVAALQEEIAKQTNVPAIYQRLLARGKQFESSEITLEEAGIEHRTKIMLMRNALYAQEKEGFEVLSKLSQEIDDLETKKDSTPANALSELITRVCCKLDEVDVQGSENLRAQRKELLRKAESLDTNNNDAS